MAYLNIPLNRNTHTTRHTRVVWLLTGFLLLMLVLWSLAVAWFTRDTLWRLAPANTVAVIRLTPSRANWSKLEMALRDIPLVSNRPVYLRDLRGVEKGEVAIFIGKDGSRSLGVHGDLKEMPSAWLESEGLIAQSVGNNAFLFSETIRPISADTKHRLHVLPDILLRRFGTIVIQTEGQGPISGTMRLGRNGIEIRLKGANGPFGDSIPLPKGTLAFLAIPSLTNITVDPFVQTVGQLLGSLDQPSIKDFTDTILRGKSQILLTQDDQGTGFLIISQAKETDMRGLLRIWAALASPGTRKTVLSDKTTINELIVDPSAVSLEESTLEGMPLLRTQAKDGSSLMVVIQQGNGTLLSNRETLIRSYLHPDTNNSIGCKKAIAYLNTPRFFTLLHSQEADLGAIAPLVHADVFKQIGVFPSWGGVTIKNCE